MQIKLLGQTLYYILTTGSGQQTLGEEYCDVCQVYALAALMIILFFCFAGQIIGTCFIT